MTAEPGLRVFYGGTFDPVHNAHLGVARAAHRALQVDVRFVPAADPPHRPAPGASASQRVDMLRLAIAGEPGLRIDLHEVDRGGRSWSIDTLTALRAQLGPRAPIAWLVGADSFLDLPSWKDWRDLPGLAHFVVAGRPGHPLDAGLPPALANQFAGHIARAAGDLEAAPAGLLLYLQQPLAGDSATDIRRRIAAGSPWRQLVPGSVADYIVRHQLYRGLAA